MKKKFFGRNKEIIVGIVESWNSRKFTMIDAAMKWILCPVHTCPVSPGRGHAAILPMISNYTLLHQSSVSQKSLNAFSMHWNLLIGKVGLLARRGAGAWAGGEWYNRNRIGFPLSLTRWHLPICMQYAMTISFLIPASTRRFLQYYNCVVCTLVDKYAHGKLKVESWYGNAEWVGSKLSCLYKIQSTTAPAARSRSRSFICVLKLLTYFDPSSSQHQQHFYRHQSKIFIKWKMIMWRICVSQWSLTPSISWSWPLQSISGSRVVECSMFTFRSWATEPLSAAM